MGRIMQLSVAKGQQPIRGTGCINLQPVVASSKDTSREEFGRLFNSELDRIGAPAERARIGWVFKTLRDKNRGKKLVSREQVRKWIKGIDFPDRANLWTVCRFLELDWTRLQPGIEPPSHSPLYVELQAVWDDLREDQQYSLLNYAKYIRDEANNNKARPEGSDSEGERASLQRHRRA
jgi:hypothetical protein